MAGGGTIAEEAETENPPGPHLVELIWSFWLEEGRLAETMRAISLRFQNRRRAGHDPLAELKIDFLRHRSAISSGSTSRTSNIA